MAASRRTFLKQSTAAAATFTIAGTRATGRVLGSNDTIRIGVAGLHGRGGSHVGEFSKMEGVQVTYLVDPDKRTWGRRVDDVKKNGGNTPKCVQDVREALEDGELDAISIATPNHWHSLMTIWGCQAGKDVYVEKPCSHDVHEGRMAVAAARKFNRIVQHGTQSRSKESVAKLASLVQSGKYGKLLVSRGLCYKPRGSIGFKPDATPPAELDYSIWLGPAPELPYNENFVHYNWHWFWPFGNGDIGNQGVHEIDMARWMIPGATLPKGVFSLGGRFGYEDQGQTANTQVAVYDYGDDQPKLVFEVRGLKTDGFLGEKIGNILHFEDGTVAGGMFLPKGSDKAEKLPSDLDGTRGPGGGNHFANFIAAVRSRDKADLNAELLEGHYSAALCHLGNISYRLGQDVSFTSTASTPFESCAVTCEAFDRMKEHLSGENGISLSGLSYKAGRMLAFDPAKERFSDDEQANEHLARQGRKGFEIPTI